VEGEQPSGCGDAPAFYCHAVFPRMEGATLGGHQGIQGRHTSAKRGVTPTWRVEVWHHAQLPVDGVVGLIQQRTAGWHLGGGAHRRPARLLGLTPVAHALSGRLSSRSAEVLDAVAEPWAQRHDPPAGALAPPVQHGVALRACSPGARGPTRRSACQGVC
jgi:hypothetical protein